MAHSPISASFASLKSLATLITTSINSLESACEDLNVPWPALSDATYVSKAGFTRDDILRMQSEAITRASATIVAAATQLVSTVREPGMSAAFAGLGFIVSSALRAATELHVIDILRDAGPEGLHVDEIASKVKVDPSKLARVLRVLVANHIFTEARPNVFANNRISAALEKGQSVEVLIQNPAGKYDRPESAVSALICHFTDEVFKSAVNVFETLVDADSAFSGSPSKCPAMRSRELFPDLEIKKPHENGQIANGAIIREEALDLKGPSMWNMLARPDPPRTYLGFERERLRRFGVAMEGGARMHPVEEVLEGFDFASLPASSVIVDVGGGVGTIGQLLRKKYDNLKIVVQDREEVCEEGVRRWKEMNPEALESGRVTFQPQNFFSPQPAYTPESKPAAFLLKHILHDWSDGYCRAILKHLRDASGSDGSTRLLVLDSVVPYACDAGGEDDKSEEAEARRNIPGVYQDQAPATLMANWGGAGTLPYGADMIMLCALNGQERTLAHTRALYRSAGWEIVKVTQAKRVGQPFALVEAKAV